MLDNACPVCIIPDALCNYDLWPNSHSCLHVEGNLQENSWNGLYSFWHILCLGFRRLDNLRACSKFQYLCACGALHHRLSLVLGQPIAVSVPVLELTSSFLFVVCWGIKEATKSMALFSMTLFSIGSLSFSFYSVSCSLGERFDNGVSYVSETQCVERELAHLLFLGPMAHSEAMRKAYSSPTLYANGSNERVSILALLLCVHVRAELHVRFIAVCGWLFLRISSLFSTWLLWKWSRALQTDQQETSLCVLFQPIHFQDETANQGWLE